MSTLANVVVALVALLHVYFLVLEMFLWDKPAGLRAFGQTPAAAAATKVLAANQGIYNGFLAAGLWGQGPGPCRADNGSGRAPRTAGGCRPERDGPVWPSRTGRWTGPCAKHDCGCMALR